MMSSPSSASPLPSVPPTLIPFPWPPSPLEDITSPPPSPQVAPFVSPSPPAPPPLPQIKPFASPPSPPSPVVILPPIIPTPSLAPPPALTIPPPPLVAAPPPDVAFTPIIPVSSPLPPEPPVSSSTSPPFPTIPLSPALPPAPPDLPSSSETGTPLPHVATPTLPSPTPLATPLANSSPPAEVLPAPTEPSYIPPAAYPLEPPIPPTSSVNSPPLLLPLPHVNLPENSRQSHLPSGVIIGFITGGVFLLLVLGLVCLSYKSRRSRNQAREEHFYLPPSSKQKGQSEHGLPQHVIKVQTETFSLPPPSNTSRGSECMVSGSENPCPVQSPYVALALSSGTFTYDELLSATDGFSEANLIGEGGFGYVHKGVLRNGQQVAIKQLKEGSAQGEREFQAEVEIISRVHHKHLVSLTGYCIYGTRRLLIYEFVPNNTLEFHLHGNGQPVMDWPTRLKIAIGSAKGLAYLHEDCNPVIIHRDIKASNILLDHKFEAKVSDFGLAKSLSNVGTSTTHSSTRVVGTFGYLAPEYATSGKVTEKSDVYSYGIMLLELITGRPPISDINSVIREALVTWVRPLLTQALEKRNFGAIVDPKLENNYNTNEMASMVACAAACVRHSSWLRPRMSQIARALEGDISTVDLNEGTNPGYSNVYGITSSVNTALASSQYGSSRHSGTTSEYGLNSCSSSSNSSNRWSENRWSNSEDKNQEMKASEQPLI